LAAASAPAQQKHDSTEGASVQSGAAGKSMSNEAKKGSADAASGTLMDKRAKAMSPEGASSGNKSGEIKQ